MDIIHERTAGARPASLIRENSITRTRDIKRDASRAVSVRIYFTVMSRRIINSHIRCASTDDVLQLVYNTGFIFVCRSSECDSIFDDLVN